MKSYAGAAWSAESKDACFDVVAPATSLDEPVAVGSSTMKECKLSARYDDGAGGNADTQTTFGNNHTSTLDITCEVRLP
jgi:hypothetical protein